METEKGRGRHDLPMEASLSPDSWGKPHPVLAPAAWGPPTTVTSWDIDSTLCPSHGGIQTQNWFKQSVLGEAARTLSPPPR